MAVDGIQLPYRTVRVEMQVTKLATVLEYLAAVGGQLESVYGKMIQASIPIANLDRLTEHPAVIHVRKAIYSVDFAVAGEGPSAMSADDWHAAGITGQGIKVGIIDGGFDGYQALQSSGDLPTNLVAMNNCADGFYGTDHGAAVAEIVAETAPGATLYLICANTPTEKGAALTYAKQQGIKLITSSTGSAGFDRGDGSGGAGSLDAIVEDAAASGILWINAVGNYADGGHWSGTFSDTDADDFHNFSSTDEINDVYIPSGYGGCVILKWDDWPYTSNDYDLYLIRQSDVAVVAASEYIQDGSQIPVEALCYENTGGSGWFGVVIARYAATSTPPFNMYSNELSFEYSTAAGSIAEPGSNSVVLGVGAVCWSQNTIGSYSSRGPTIDGRIKPDIAGLDSVSSGTYGPFSSCGISGFAGTSAAAPHVAGAAALIMQQNPTWNAATVRSYLETNAVDLGPSGKDNDFGSGKLALPSPSAPSTPSPTPSPTASITPTPTPSPSPTTPTTSYHSRSISLRLRHHLKVRGRVSVLDGFSSCAQGAPIKVQRRKSGRWVTLKTVYSDSLGYYSASLSDRPGRYRVKSPAGYHEVTPNDICLGVTSTIKTHAH